MLFKYIAYGACRKRIRQAGGTPNLDYKHTVFGQVYEGLDIAFEISGVKTDENDRPKEDIIISSIEISVVE